MIRFAERWAGERFVGVPERRVAVVQYTITTRVDGDVESILELLLVVDKETNAPTSAFPCELFRSVRAVDGEPRKLDG